MLAARWSRFKNYADFSLIPWLFPDHFGMTWLFLEFPGFSTFSRWVLTLVIHVLQWPRKTGQLNITGKRSFHKRCSRRHQGISQAESPDQSTALICRWQNLRLSGWRRDLRIRIPVLHWTHFHVFCLQHIHTFTASTKWDYPTKLTEQYNKALPPPPPPHHNRFTALFPRPPGWAGTRKLLDFMVQARINRGRHIDHPAGRHSIQTNQCPRPPSPIFTGRMPFLPPNQQCQSTEGNNKALPVQLKSTDQ